MLQKTPGFVLKNTKYGESSVISKIYTRAFGIQTYIINSVQSPKAPIRASLLQPLVLLDLVVYHTQGKEIQRIKEAKASPTLYSLHHEITKSSIGIFWAELLYRSLKEEEPNEALYDFIAESIIRLDHAEEGLAMYPMFFALRLSRFLGFEPQDDYQRGKEVFDLREGNFTGADKLEIYAIRPPESYYFHSLLGVEWDGLANLSIPKMIRITLLEKLVSYYRLHLNDFNELKSIGILAEVMRD